MHKTLSFLIENSKKILWKEGSSLPSNGEVDTLSPHLHSAFQSKQVAVLVQNTHNKPNKTQ